MTSAEFAVQALSHRVHYWREQTPDAVAVSFGERRMTYRELDDASSRLAALLRARGCGDGVFVGVQMHRCEQMIVALLAIMKAGAAVVPLDPDERPERLALLLSEADVSIIVTTTMETAPSGQPVEYIQLDDTYSSIADLSPAPPGTDNPDAAAYLLFTSGSTGRSKGVLVEHRQLATYLCALAQRIELSSTMRWALVQPMTVDSSLTAIGMALGFGGELLIVPKAVSLDPNAFADLLAARPVDALKIAPSHLRALESSERFIEILPRSLLIVGGEASDWDWLRDVQRRSSARVMNHYGPTETTVGVTTLWVDQHLEESWSTAPIGVPLPGVELQVRSDGEPLAGNGSTVSGELIVLGGQVARGYHPPADSDAFGETAEGRRSFATGDLVAQVDGILHFLGRNDDQIKVRGFRVALGEIESTANRHPSIARSVASIRPDFAGGRVVVLHIEPSSEHQSPAVADVFDFLRDRLPDHMIPVGIGIIGRIPLSPHGKVDRAALAGIPVVNAADTTTAALGSPWPRPFGDVAAIWSELIGADVNDLDRNFFDAGGHSLLLVELQFLLSTRLGADVDLMDLFEETTIRRQTALVEKRRRGT